MATLSTTAPVLPSELKPSYSKPHISVFPHRRLFPLRKNNNQSFVPVARLFGPSMFESSKLKVLFLGVDQDKHPATFPRIYTLTHSDLTSKLTLAISQTINNSQLQGWYQKLQRDEVVAQWVKIKGNMYLHVHCHISGGHFLLDLFARLRYFIFSKELPLVLKAFVHGDGNLFNNYPELEESLVWVFFHSNTPEFNKVECWGPLKDASAPRPTTTSGAHEDKEHEASPSNLELARPCQEDCDCCFPPVRSIPRFQETSPLDDASHDGGTQHYSNDPLNSSGNLK
ncbi:hypothetical protein K1719_041092 [Acacia pycnantha]|nr:hypothetical protein K1719_041391 [Acacia pycnantha]KAI9076930.1 hypothetical protein K1719_041092 [Acacia pycnantha]